MIDSKLITLLMVNELHSFTQAAIEADEVLERKRKGA